MKKILIIGSGLSGLICANLFKEKKLFDVYLLEKHNLDIKKLEEYYKIKKKNLHPHAFTSLFCYYLKKYLPELYYDTKKTNFFDRVILKNINISKKDFNSILFKNINKKINFYNRVLDLKFKVENKIISEVNFFSQKRYHQIKDIDYVLDCSGVNSFYENNLKKINNLDIYKISKYRSFTSFFFTINDQNNLSRLNQLLFSNSITIYDKNYNLSIIKYNNNFSATFVSSNKDFKEKKYSKNVLKTFLKKNGIENISIKNELKWFHLSSNFLKFYNSDNVIENLIPVGECFMKTNPEHGNGSTLSLLQGIYILNNIKFKFDLSKYINVFFELFKILEENNIYFIKNSNKKFLKKFIPFYFELRFFYNLHLQKKKFKKVINHLN